MKRTISFCLALLLVLVIFFSIGIESSENNELLYCPIDEDCKMDASVQSVNPPGMPGCKVDGCCNHDCSMVLYRCWHYTCEEWVWCPIFLLRCTLWLYNVSTTCIPADTIPTGNPGQLY